VESVYGKGSKFIFYIKAVGNELQSLSSDKENEYMCDKKVLVVDDNEVNRVMICSFLNEWGAKPISCSSAKEALFYVQKNIMTFDLALLDIRMPFMDGNELAQQISDSNSDIPLIALSSVPMPAHKINKNFRFYLTKPIKSRKLKEICLEIFRNIKPNDAHIPRRKGTSSVKNLLSIPENDGSQHSSDNVNYNNNNNINSISPQSNKYFKIPVNTNKYATAKIILAEDMYINQKVTIQILNKLGYKNIDLAEDGKKLVDKIISTREDYDLILMDLKMPIMNGFDAALAIHKLYMSSEYINRQKPKIIALTARVMSGVKQKCIESGMDDYITKPMEIDLLNEKIKKVLGD